MSCSVEAGRFGTPELRAAHMDTVLEDCEDLLLHLFWRWQDEHDYEDFAEYKDALRKGFAHHGEVLRARKRPFGLDLRIEGFPYDVTVTVTTRHIGWKQAKRRAV